MVDGLIKLVIGYKKGSFKVSVMITGISKIVQYDVWIRKVHNNLLGDDKKLACFWIVENKNNADINHDEIIMKMQLH